MGVYMKLFTKLSVTCATLAMIASTMSHAGSIQVPEYAVDRYIGADGRHNSSADYIPDSSYDISWMQVERTINGSVGSLEVTINSNFVQHNSQSGFSFGDLFMMNADADSGNYQQADSCMGGQGYGCNEYSEQTYNSNSNNATESPNKWQYAFDLGSTYNNSARNSSFVNDETGRLREIDQNNYDSQVISTSSNRDWQAILVSNNAKKVGMGSWGTDYSSKLLTMTFDITGTSLMDAAQIALRWQMTCANDIIEVVRNFSSSKPPGGSTSVPEPSSIMLMLLAGLGFIAIRRKKSAGFKA